MDERKPTKFDELLGRLSLNQAIAIMLGVLWLPLSIITYAFVEKVLNQRAVAEGVANATWYHPALFLGVLTIVGFALRSFYEAVRP